MHERIKNILVPTDFSNSAKNALEVGIALAKRHSAQLHILHVIIPQYISYIGEVDIPYDNWNDLEKISKNKLLETSKSIIKKHKINVVNFIDIGIVSESIEKYASKLHIDLVVMGMNGMRGINEHFVGRNTFQVIKNAICPVFAIPEKFSKSSFQQVLFPIGNTSANVDFDNYWALKNMIPSDDLEIDLLGISRFEDYETSDRVKEKVSELSNFIKKDGLKASFQNIFCDNITRFILEYASINQSDLIVINPNIDSDWEKFVLGNNMRKIINQAQCPILLIKPMFSNLLTIEKNTLNYSNQN
ncbi:UspA domain-containing protein [Emticicia oligotrophica DSM 17448]|uniref:UspA domain-containing protein n=1 Tax=Emticicia oligotrophica (strain DSM 17448 / CIP 109782 / MTCC 6937 / GPTSA100-15) TaxID=929562 RepID=A0ABM5N610_EMTOG|nr:universal stress protein [Emticicia oligotrophica]AFK04949.1 UspA domain-containing protein [Emticicia oligotrophica DSM 17448]